MIHLNTCTLIPLANDTIAKAKKLCDEHIGQDFYTMESLQEALDQENHFFYFMYKEKEMIGFFHACYCSFTEMAKFEGKISSELENLCQSKEHIGICCAIGLSSAHRRAGISDEVLGYMTDLLLNQQHCPLILVQAWKIGDVIPAKRLLEENGYKMLCTQRQPWHSYEKLKCQACGQERCVCDAVIYYRKAE